MNSNATADYSAYTNYKLDDGSVQYMTNAFPARPLFFSGTGDGAWIVQYKEKAKKDFDANRSNQKLNEIEQEEQLSIAQKVPKRQILKISEDEERTGNSQSRLLDGFYLMQMCCIEDPSDVVSLNLSGKDLNHIREEDLALFDNVIEINANENSLNFEGFRAFPKLKKLSLVCNNIKTIHLKHSDFLFLEVLDLSFNHLNSNDIAHLGILVNMKSLRLSGNNLCYLPDTFSKSYVTTNEKKQKFVAEKFPKLEELYLDKNELNEESSFDVLATLKKLKKLYLNDNKICCIPQLKLIGQNHVFQEFSKSYYKRKNSKKLSKDEKYPKEFSPQSLDNKLHTRSPINIPANEKLGMDLDLHKSNLLRNSFILEEEEYDNLDMIHNLNNNNDNISSDKDSSNNVIHPPFAELTFIDLANNKFKEEEDLIALASWPMLNEVVLYGNPIILRNIGYPPLLKKFLVDRLGINIHRSRVQTPKPSLCISPHKERIVSSYVPKVPKVPVDMKMLTYDPINHSENKTPSAKDKNELDKPLSPIKEESKKQKYSPFFMTQAEQDEQDEIAQLNQIFNEGTNKIIDKFEGYELFLDIEDEEQVQAPTDLGSCVRALRHLLDHPLVFRDTNVDLQKPQNFYNPKTKTKSSKNNPNKEAGFRKPKPLLEEIDNILQQTRNRNITEEKDLQDALNNGSKEEYDLAKTLLKQVQAKYNKVRYESLQNTKSQISTIKEAKDTLKKLNDYTNQKLLNNK